MTKIEFILNATHFSEKSIENIIHLLEGGATIPFISRYRKEKTGGMDEVDIARVRDEASNFETISTRQKSIISTINEQGKLTDELHARISNCFDLNQLEDIYLPFKQKRLTRGEKAKKNGLEPLAKMIIAQRDVYLSNLEKRFSSKNMDFETALSGAKDIIAEWINEKADLRERLRNSFENHAVLISKVVKSKMDEAQKYKDYFDHSEKLNRCSSHRFLAIYRANREGFLTLKARPNEEYAIQTIERFFVRGSGELAEVVKEACRDAYKRLLLPSLENEILSKAKEKADLEAIKVFSKNLKQLLLASPLGSKRILAIDPGFRTGCKVVCLDETGSLLTNATIFPHPPQKESGKAKSKLAQLVQAYKIEAIAIGDGTAGRETESLVKQIRFDRDLDVFSVNEDGASIYSASSIAREEFPDYDVTVRGAISIGRRLMDPLAELVKIDPKSVGVGQYQHEVNQKRLKDSLDDVVVSCVNTVGVDLNTASEYLLRYVSGLGETLAKNIIDYRSENGRFNSRKELKSVKRLGEKAFEQCAGFLRIKNGIHPLDNSAVHPESYALVKKMAKSVHAKVEDLLGNEELINKINQEEFTDVDAYTMEDILVELKKPGLDPRKKVKVLEFDSRLKTIDDVREGMELTGIVTNVTNFGAFVNIGIKENGLIHKSNLSNEYVEEPSDYVSLHEHVKVKVIEVDKERKRIGLRKIN